MLGISYPPAVNKYPALAQQLSTYAEHAKAELLKAVDELGNDTPTAPYELSLAFDLLVDTPQVVAVSAEGSSYTGGAHGQPLVARFVWLPRQERMLTAQELLASPKGWQAVSDYASDKLLEQAMVRAQGEDMTPEEQQAGVGQDEELVGKLMDILLELRRAARERKDWATADAVRNKLQEAGIVVEDSPQGARWKRA